MNTTIFAFVVGLVALGQLNNTLLIPSLPEMVKSFASSEGVVKLSLTMCLVAFGITQFIYGPLSDKYGRKKTALAGLIIFSFGSLLCCVADTIPMLMLSRSIQGAGVGCVGPISRAISRDSFSGARYLKNLSYLSVAMAIAPAISPALGGALQQNWGWRAGCWLLFILGFGMLLILHLRLPETNTNKLTGKLSVSYIYKNYAELCLHPRFIGLLLCNMLVYAGEIGFLVSASFILQSEASINPASFGLISLLIVPCMLAGSLTLSRLSTRLEAKHTAIVGISFVLLGAILMSVVGLISGLSLIGMAIPMMVYAFGEGILAPSTSAGSMSLFPHKAGFAGSLSGGLAMFGAGLINALMESVHLKSQASLGTFLLAIGLAILTIFYLLAWRNWQAVPTKEKNS